MKRFINFLIFIALIAPWSDGLQAQSIVKVQTNKLVVQGSSSLHDWESEITKAEWKGSFVIKENSLVAINNVVVKIPVESIKSTKGKIMDSKTYDAFDYKKNPNIIYTLSQAKITANGNIEAKGNLTMAGVTKPIELILQSKILPGGNIQIILSKKLKMTDFKMEPPTAMMGTIKVGDEVTVVVDVIISTTPNQ